MVTMEMVEKLLKYGNITYEDAKRALEETKGDMLDAVILLEKQGKIKPPENNGSFTAKNEEQSDEKNDCKDSAKVDETSCGTHFKNFLRGLGKVIRKGNVNSLDVKHKGELVISIPVTILVAVSIFFFWITVPLLIIGLFFNYSYKFRGPDLGNDKVNNVVNSVANAADDLKKSVKETSN